MKLMFAAMLSLLYACERGNSSIFFPRDFRNESHHFHNHSIHHNDVYGLRHETQDGVHHAANARQGRGELEHINHNHTQREEEDEDEDHHCALPAHCHPAKGRPSRCCHRHALLQHHRDLRDDTRAHGPDRHPPRKASVPQDQRRAQPPEHRSSTALQQKLFLHGIATDPSNVWAFDGQTLLAGVHAKKAIQDANTTAVPPLTTTQPYLCNPLICHKLTKADPYASVNPGPWSAAKAMGKKWDRDCTIKINHNIDINKVPLKAPCRAMFVSQPPVKEVYIEIYGRVRYADWEDRRGLNKWHWAPVKELTVRNEAGVRFGEIVDAVREGLKGTWRGEFHHMRFVGGIPVSTEEMAFVETAGEVTWRSDKFAEQSWTPK
ncbi:hypothetical protein LTS10_006954 [Elasticomyces elasticus]|nr:hypothetical protein LTS10_006954 [Elasticomyces elasticus]